VAAGAGRCVRVDERHEELLVAGLHQPTGVAAGELGEDPSVERLVGRLAAAGGGGLRGEYANVRAGRRY